MVSRFTPPPLYDGATLRPSRGCLNCRHYFRNRREGACQAFPEGIPFDIISGQTPHAQAIPGDNGIQWEPADDAPLGTDVEQSILDALEKGEDYGD